MDVGDWLRGLGLERYEALFRESDIDPEVLPELTDQHLKDLGVSFGHRLKMLRAIREMARDAPVKAQPSPPAGPKPQDAAERRQLTVMFCDLVGSTALSARLDPEDMREIIGSYHRCCATSIERNGGFVAKYMGDGVLAYFGFPHAHEDDAERAVRAGVDTVAVVTNLETAAKEQLKVRIGIATGIVVVGDLVGQGSAQEQAVVALDLFGRLVDRLPDLRALLVLTFRPEFVAPLVGRANVATLSLGRFGRRQAVTMIDKSRRQAIAGGSTRVNAEQASKRTMCSPSESGRPPNASDFSQILSESGYSLLKVGSIGLLGTLTDAQEMPVA